MIPLLRLKHSEGMPNRLYIHSHLKNSGFAPFIKLAMVKLMRAGAQLQSANLLKLNFFKNSKARNDDSSTMTQKSRDHNLIAKTSEDMMILSSVTQCLQIVYILGSCWHHWLVLCYICRFLLPNSPLYKLSAVLLLHMLASAVTGVLKRTL